MQRLIKPGLMLLMLVLALGSHAQQYVMIKGQVWDLSGEELVGAHAYNITRHYGTFTDIEGIFFLVMNPGDSLRVSMVGYKPYTMKIPQRLSADSYKLDVTLIGDTIILRTAEIKPYPATYAEFKTEFLKLRVPEEVLFEKTRIPNIVYRSKYANPDGGGILLPGPFSLLYNAFSKEGKELKKMNSILAVNRIREQLLNVIPRATLEKQYGLKTDDDIDVMISRCGITSEMLQSMSDYDIIKYVAKCAR